MERALQKVGKLADLEDKFKERDRLMKKLDYAVVHEAQKELDNEAGINPREVAFNLSALEDLELAVAQAFDQGVELIEFGGRQMLTRYAQYVCKYVSKQFKGRPENFKLRAYKWRQNRKRRQSCT